MRMPKQEKQLSFDDKLLITYSIDIIGIFGFKRWISRAIFISGWLGKYFVFLICSQEYVHAHVQVRI